MDELNKIPKRIFFYWEGDKMSWMRYMTLYSFRKYNPDWKMVLYLNKNPKIKVKPWKCINSQDFFSYVGDDYFDLLSKLNIEIVEWDLSDNKIKETDLVVSPSHKSNFLKWSKLHEDGGIYSDMDILFFKPIDSFYDELIDGCYDTAICQTKYLSIGFLASKKHNEFFRDIFINGISKFNKDDYQTAGVMNIYDLYDGVSIDKVLDAAKIKYKNLKFYNIPMNLLYFLDSTKINYAINNSLNINKFPAESIGYHWYAGHPNMQKLNNLLNENNYMNHNNTFTCIAKEILNGKS